MSGVVVFSNAAPPKGQTHVTATFQVPTAGQYLLFATGSGRVDSQGLIQISVSLNGNLIGYAIVWTNEGQSHKAVVPLAAIVTLTAGQNSAEITAVEGTQVDFNDRFTMTLVAL